MGQLGVYLSLYDACVSYMSISPFYSQIYASNYLSLNTIYFLTVFEAMQAGTLSPSAVFGSLMFSTIALACTIIYVTTLSSVTYSGLWAAGLFHQYVQFVGMGACMCTLVVFNLESIRARLHKLVHGRDRPAAFDVFLTHDWGTDEHGRNNHERVALVNAALKRAGLVTWFDEERMQGDIVSQMTDGIDRSSVVLVFVTRNYICKVAGEGPNGANDNCKAEFDYACNRKGVERMVAVVMEAGCADTREWRGAVGMRLGGHLYHDLSADAAQLAPGLNTLTEGLSALLLPQAAPRAGPLRRAQSSLPIVRLCNRAATTDFSKETQKMSGRLSKTLFMNAWQYLPRISRLSSDLSYRQLRRSAAFEVALSLTLAGIALLALAVIAMYPVPGSPGQWTRNPVIYETFNYWVCIFSACPLLMTLCVWVSMGRLIRTMQCSSSSTEYQRSAMARELQRAAIERSCAEKASWGALIALSSTVQLVMAIYFTDSVSQLRYFSWLQTAAIVACYKVVRNFRSELLRKVNRRFQAYGSRLQWELSAVLCFQAFVMCTMIAYATHMPVVVGSVMGRTQICAQCNSTYMHTYCQYAVPARGDVNFQIKCHDNIGFHEYASLYGACEAQRHHEIEAQAYTAITLAYNSLCFCTRPGLELWLSS